MKFSSLNAHICSVKQLAVKRCKNTCNKSKSVDGAEMKGE
jgi:hypothetical protein